MKRRAGYLIHMSHYDPAWIKRKRYEKPFDLKLGIEIVDALKEEGFDALFIGVSDGVIYKSHPELKKHYSVPMKELAALAAHARKAGLEVVPKLNFSKSPINQHDCWGIAPGVQWYEDFDDMEAYLKRRFECIDEVLAACGKCKLLHVGMDEDHTRSYTQYCDAIKALRGRLKERGLRTAVWNDMAISYPNGDIFVEKSAMALERVPKDVLNILWAYRAVPERQVKAILSKGFELWGAPGLDPKQAGDYLRVLARHGASGALMTTWRKCVPSNRKELLSRIRELGPVYREAFLGR